MCYTARMPTGITFDPNRPAPTATPGPDIFMTDEQIDKAIAKAAEEKLTRLLKQKEKEAKKARDRWEYFQQFGGEIFAPAPPPPPGFFEALGYDMFSGIIDATIDWVTAYPKPMGTTPGIRHPNHNSGNFARPGSNSWTRGKGGVYTPIAGLRVRRRSPGVSGGLLKSQKLSANWRRLPVSWAHGDAGGAVNDVTYAGFVHGLQQSGVMKRRGWRTLEMARDRLRRMSWDRIVVAGVRLYLAVGYGIITDAYGK